jgi:spermidine synthase
MPQYHAKGTLFGSGFEEIAACRTVPRRARVARMDKLFEELDFRPTPIGDLILQRRKFLQLDGQVVYEVKLGDAFLMSSMFHEVEEALSRLGLGALDGEGWDVVVGGLGLGYTAVAALAFHELRSLLVVDALEGVIDWHQREMVPLGKTMNDDPRCRYVLGDFFELATEPGKNFDPDAPDRKFHAVLLDIDHSPRNLLAPRNAAFYTTEGLRKLASRLHPQGVFALWSDDAPDAAFMADLRTVFRDVRAEVVPFPNPLLDTTSESTVYVARL